MEFNPTSEGEITIRNSCTIKKTQLRGLPLQVDLPVHATRSGLLN